MRFNSAETIDDIRDIENSNEMFMALQFSTEKW